MASGLDLSATAILQYKITTAIHVRGTTTILICVDLTTIMILQLQSTAALVGVEPGSVMFGLQSLLPKFLMV